MKGGELKYFGGIKKNNKNNSQKKKKNKIHKNRSLGEKSGQIPDIVKNGSVFFYPSQKFQLTSIHECW